MSDTKKVMADLENRFNIFIVNVSNEVCNTFEPIDLGMLITSDEMESMEREGYFHPDTDEEDTRKKMCSTIANRLHK